MSNKKQNEQRGQLATSIVINDDINQRSINSPIRQNSPSKSISKKHQFIDENQQQEPYQPTDQHFSRVQQSNSYEQQSKKESRVNDQSYRYPHLFQSPPESPNKVSPSSPKKKEKSLQRLPIKNKKDPVIKEQNKKKVPKSKRDLKQLEKIDKYRLLQIKNGIIKNKVGDLRDKMEKQYYQNKNNLKIPEHDDVRNSDYYDLSNPRTIEASQFVSQIQHKRKLQKRRYEEHQKAKKNQEQYMMEYIRMEKMKERQEKKKLLQYEYQLKWEIQQREKQTNQRKKQQIKEWAKLFQKQKPLYIRREEEFYNNYIVPQMQLKQSILLEKKLQNKPIDKQELDAHDEKYMEFKRDDQIRKQAYLGMIRQQNQSNKGQLNHLYKGRFRYQVLQAINSQKNPQDPKQVERIKRARQVIYGDQVKQQLKRKNIQTLDTQRNFHQEFQTRKRNVKGSYSVDNDADRKNPKEDGKEFLHYVHNLVKEKGIKKKDSPHIRIIEEKKGHYNYIPDVKQKRNQVSLDLGDEKEEEPSLNKSHNLNSLKAKADNLDRRLKRNQMRKKHKQIGHDEDIQMQMEQLSAIKAKMKLLHKID